MFYELVVKFEWLWRRLAQSLRGWRIFKIILNHSKIVLWTCNKVWLTLKEASAKSVWVKLLRNCWNTFMYYHMDSNFVYFDFGKCYFKFQENRVALKLLRDPEEGSEWYGGVLRSLGGSWGVLYWVLIVKNDFLRG